MRQTTIALLITSALLTITPAFATSDEVLKLQRQLDQRDQALLEMLNKVNAHEETIRALKGKVTDLTERMTNLEVRNRDLLSEIDVLKADLKYGRTTKTPPAVNPVKEAPKTSAPVTVTSQPKPAPTTQPKVDTPVAPVNTSVADDSTKAQAKITYDGAIAKLNNGQYADAKQLFQSYIDQYPQESLVSNCYYWLGQISYNEKNYATASENFLKVTTYKDSNKRAGAIFKLGQIAEAQNDKDKAKKFYQVLLKSYPNGTEATLAKQALQHL